MDYLYFNVSSPPPAAAGQAKIVFTNWENAFSFRNLHPREKTDISSPGRSIWVTIWRNLMTVEGQTAKKQVPKRQVYGKGYCSGYNAMDYTV